MNPLSSDECQQVFRILLDALARPGTIAELPLELGDPLDLPLLALTDGTTPIAALDPTEDEMARVTEIHQLTQAPLAPVLQARFVVSYRDPDPLAMAELNTGCDDRPHEAALLIQSAMVAEQPQPDFSAWQLSGPGIDGTTQIQVAGLSRSFFRARDRLVAGYPQGVDVVLVSPSGAVLGLPRTTRIFEVTR